MPPRAVGSEPLRSSCERSRVARPDHPRSAPARAVSGSGPSSATRRDDATAAARGRVPGPQASDPLQAGRSMTPRQGRSARRQGGTRGERGWSGLAPTPTHMIHTWPIGSGMGLLQQPCVRGERGPTARVFDDPPPPEGLHKPCSARLRRGVGVGEEDTNPPWRGRAGLSRRRPERPWSWAW